MDILNLFPQDSLWIQWVVLPILICAARILDQSIGTLRLIFLSKGMKKITPFLAFFESLIWLIAVSQILKHMDNFMTFIAYGLGFALGNYIGILLEEKISIGNAIVRIFPHTDTTDFIEYMKLNNFGYTLMNAEGSKGPLKIIFSIVKRKHLSEFLNKTNEILPDSFYTVEDVKSVKQGIFKNSDQSIMIKSFFGTKKIK